ncbi:MAG: hypothetical protein IJ866_03750 [Alphaproteobacteria bacterium]|nr:hypothetical protein [Alphaproteobacteria bacterium]
MASILQRNKDLKPKPKKTREEYAEDALYREVWEEVNNDKTTAFIKKYYRQMLAAALVIMIAVTGIQIGIREYRARQIARAINYETAVENVDAAALASIGENTSGATADLALFQAYMLTGDAEKIEKLARDGDTRDFRDLARLHVIGIRGDEMTGADVEKYLSDLNTKSSPFYYTAMLTIAQKYLSEDNRDAANKWLDKIIKDENAPASISGTAQMLR